MFFELLETHKNGFAGEWSDAQTAEVTVVMPCTDVAQAIRAAQRMVRFAGMPLRMVIVNDVIRQGFIKTVNAVSNHLKPEYLAYVAQDSLAGKNWLKIAFDTLKENNKSVCAFNDGVFWGGLAQFGLVRVAFTSMHYGAHNVFHDQYVKHRADDELTHLAKLNDEYVFAGNALLMEVDYSLARTVHPPDLQTYTQRKIMLMNQFGKSK